MKAINITELGVTPSMAAGAGVNTGQNGQTGQLKDGAIFAGNMTGMSTDRIEQRREQARKQANKTILDQFARDSEVSDAIKENHDKIKDLQTERSAVLDTSREYKEKTQKLKEAYGIEDDSQEQKELELVIKAQKLEKTGQLSSMSKEELERLQNMGPLTEYQEKALVYNAADDYCNEQVDAIDREIMSRGRANYELKQGILKQNGMNDAKKEAGDIMKAASDDIIGMLMSEAKEHIDEEMEKLIEAAKEAAEKKETEEAQKEKAEEKDKEQEKMIEDIQDSVEQQDSLKAEVGKILEEAKLLDEDMKGLVVSQEI